MQGIYIFGAHSRARTIKEYLEKLDPEIKVQAYLYDNDEENPESTDGIPVLDLRVDEVCERLDRNLAVYLGVKGINQEKAVAHLKELGFERIIPLTVSLDTQLRNQYVRAVFEENDRIYVKLEDLTEGNPKDWLDGTGSQINKSPNVEKDETISSSKTSETDPMIAIYVASSIYDGALQEHHDFLPFEKVIQVGCSLTEERLGGAVYDNVGDSISDRNKQFCELTALYWIWKNADQAYVGLEHYRRFFIVPQNIVQIMAENRVDVVLPVPLYVAPSVEENYIFRHEPKVWADMLAYLKNHSEEEYHAAKVFFSQGLYSPCNMLIARKEVYDGLCEWMFPILFEVAKKNGTLADRYQNRYPGFLSERLISFFFDYHRKDYRTVYADKVFLQ